MRSLSINKMKDIVIDHGPDLKQYIQLKSQWMVTCEHCHKDVRGIFSSAFNTGWYPTKLGDSDGHWFCSKRCVMLWNLNHG